jgi:hypothetical protein
MKTAMNILAMGTALMLFHVCTADARGFGGGFGGGGFRGGGFGGGGFRGEYDGGFRGGDGGGFRGNDVRMPTDGGLGGAFSGAGLARDGGAFRAAPCMNSIDAARCATVRNTFNHYDSFGSGWYAAHPGAWRPAAWADGRAWGIATWPVLGTWFAWDDDVEPIYYNFGDDITYDTSEVYQNNVPISSISDYYQQALALAQNAPAADPNSGDWMALGVFSFVQSGQSGSSSMFQLAVNKSGVLGGNYFDSITGNTLPVHGAVDLQSQRAAWFVGNSATLCEAGIGNLAQDETPVIVFTSSTQIQQWTLVRIENDNDSLTVNGDSSDSGNDDDDDGNDAQ